MRDILIAVFIVAILIRAADNLLDLALIGLQRWLELRRIPQRMRQVRADLEIQRAGIPDRIRAHCAATGCTDEAQHIAEHLADFDAKLPETLAAVEKQFRDRVGELKVTSAWQLFALLGEPDVRVQQFRNIGALIFPSSRN